MGRKGKSGSLPFWHKGRLIRDDIIDFWFGSREGKIFKQRGFNVTKQSFDSLTDEARQDSIKRR